MMIFLILMAVFSLLVVLFAMLNSQTVTLNFIFTEMQGSLAFVAIVTFCCGLLVGTCYALMQKAKHYMAIFDLKTKISQLQEKQRSLEELNTYLKEHQGQMPEAAKPQKVVNPCEQDR